MILNFEDFTTTNLDVPVGYGSASVGAPNVNLNWNSGSSAGHWDQYLNWGPGRTKKAQLDFSSPGVISSMDVIFSSDPGYESYVSSFDLDRWGDVVLNWSLLDGVTPLYNGIWNAAFDGTTNIVTGMTSADAIAGPLTLRFDFVSGGPGNVAMDNLSFGQVAAVPEPTTLTIFQFLLGCSLSFRTISRRRPQFPGAEG
jgi:hypothetical protein